ncbi:hypothetical protein WG66_010911 [Moniliophthora roreri]|nr:hypothetical protein WG66_010911 [Moniliophthora roreri]
MRLTISLQNTRDEQRNRETLLGAGVVQSAVAGAIALRKKLEHSSPKKTRKNKDPPERCDQF